MITLRFADIYRLNETSFLRGMLYLLYFKVNNNGLGKCCCPLACAEFRVVLRYHLLVISNCTKYVHHTPDVRYFWSRYTQRTVMRNPFFSLS
jgi:hypothetical protein